VALYPARRLIQCSLLSSTKYSGSVKDWRRGVIGVGGYKRPRSSPCVMVVPSTKRPLSDVRSCTSSCGALGLAVETLCGDQDALLL
jgi:hypothetical protein